MNLKNKLETTKDILTNLEIDQNIKLDLNFKLDNEINQAKELEAREWEKVFYNIRELKPDIEFGYFGYNDGENFKEEDIKEAIKHGECYFDDQCFSNWDMLEDCTNTVEEWKKENEDEIFKCINLELINKDEFWTQQDNHEYLDSYAYTNYYDNLIKKVDSHYQVKGELEGLIYAIFKYYDNEGEKYTNEDLDDFLGDHVDFFANFEFNSVINFIESTKSMINTLEYTLDEDPFFVLPLSLKDILIDYKTEYTYKKGDTLQLEFDYFGAKIDMILKKDYVINITDEFNKRYTNFIIKEVK